MLFLRTARLGMLAAWNETKCVVSSKDSSLLVRGCCGRIMRDEVIVGDRHLRTLKGPLWRCRGSREIREAGALEGPTRLETRGESRSQNWPRVALAADDLFHSKPLILERECLPSSGLFEERQWSVSICCLVIVSSEGLRSASTCKACTT